MKYKIRILFVFLLVFGLVGVLPLPAPGHPAKTSRTLTPVIPIQVNGSIRIQMRPYDTMLSATVLLKMKGRPVSNAAVLVENNKIPETKPGRYHKIMKGFKATTGKLLKVKMDPQPSPSVKMPQVICTATIGTLLRFNSPEPDAKIKLSSTRTLRVSWNAVKGPVDCYIYMLKGRTMGKQVFHKSKIRGNSITIDPRILVPNQKYGIYLFHTMGKFSLSGPTTGNSRLNLGQSLGTYLYTK